MPHKVNPIDFENSEGNNFLIVKNLIIKYIKNIIKIILTNNIR